MDIINILLHNILFQDFRIFRIFLANFQNIIYKNKKIRKKNVIFNF